MCWTAHFAQRVWMATAVAVVLLAGPGLTSPAVGQCPYNWLPGGGIPGVDGVVNAMTAWDPDGPGPRSEVLVVGGNFTVAGDVVGHHIACWDPVTSTWSALGPGVASSSFYEVFALTVLDGRLYVGGNFPIAGEASVKYIACWDPEASSWLALGSGVDDSVYALTSLGGKLYAGGSFHIAGELAVNGIACWDPATSTWAALGSGAAGVSALTVLDGKLYAGGGFTTAGGVAANRVACWDPTTSTWSALGSGVDSGVNDLTVLAGKLYVGGSFRTAGGVSADGIACWNPATATWSSLGFKPEAGASRVSALTVLDGRLYVGGEFTTVLGVNTHSIACWNPATATWSAMGSGMNRYAEVQALAVLNGKLYAGGDFNTAGGVAAEGLACWDPTASVWSAVGYGTNDAVFSLAVLGGKVYAGGDFATVGGVSAKRIACYDPVISTWSALSLGMNEDYSRVRALCPLDGKLYAGGSFLEAGGMVTPGIACWDPTAQAWSNPGWAYTVSALTALDGKLYVGGDFTTAGGVAAEGIACWDPVTSTWSALGSGLGGFPYPSEYPNVGGLAGLDNKLYVGGRFTTAGGQPANRIACWDPATATWSTLGEGMSNSVHALAVLEGKLYAGGSFTEADGVVALGIACWDPKTLTWSSLGSGVNSAVTALVALNGELYVGGHFSKAGGASANQIACWDPATSAWSALGSGMGGGTATSVPVYALIGLDDTLYAGGEFTTAGSRVSAYFARWGPVREPDDFDCDGVPDASDNCPQVANADQENADRDAIGDACDICPNDPLNDEDGDGVCGDLDQCPGTPAGAPVDAAGCSVSSLNSSKPASGKSLWRNQRNIIRLTFDWDIHSPPAGAVMIQEMLAGGAYGDDLSAGFTFAVENDGQGQPRILKIRETASTLQHRTWYAVRNTGAWTGVAPFTVQYVVQVGDANNDGRVLNTDFGWVNAAIPTFSTADDDRRDINGDGKILNTDFGVLNSKIPSFPVARPAGH